MKLVVSGEKTKVSWVETFCCVGNCLPIVCFGIGIKRGGFFDSLLFEKQVYILLVGWGKGEFFTVDSVIVRLVEMAD